MVKCQEEGCAKRASFSIGGIKPPKFCSEHRKNNMINTRHKLCEFDDCMTSATCKFKDEEELRFCAEHKEDGMTNPNKKYLY